MNGRRIVAAPFWVVAGGPVLTAHNGARAESSRKCGFTSVAFPQFPDWLPADPAGLTCVLGSARITAVR